MQSPEIHTSATRASPATRIDIVSSKSGIKKPRKWDEGKAKGVGHSHRVTNKSKYLVDQSSLPLN